MPTYDHALNLRISGKLRDALESRATACEMTLNEYARLILAHAVRLSDELPMSLAHGRRGDIEAFAMTGRPRGSTPPRARARAK